LNAEDDIALRYGPLKVKEGSVLPSERAVAAEISGPSFVTLEYLCRALDRPEGGLLGTRVRRRTIIRALERLVDFDYLVRLNRLGGRVLYTHKALWDRLSQETRIRALSAPIRTKWDRIAVHGRLDERTSHLPKSKSDPRRKTPSRARRQS